MTRQAEWTRLEMLLDGGMVMLYHVIAVYSLETVWTVWFENPVAMPGPLLMAGLLGLAGGIGMACGLYWRPSWRGWGWASCVACCAASQWMYTSITLSSDPCSAVDAVDELTWLLVASYALFRAVRGIKTDRLYRSPTDPEEEVTAHG